MNAGRTSPGLARLRDQDFLSGLLFLLVGAAARWLSRDYPLGSFMRPGSGAFPMLICWGLMILGSLILLRSFMRPGIVRVDGWHPRVLLLVTAAIICFQLTIDRLGLVVAMAGLILLAALAGSNRRPVELILFSLALMALSIGIFIYGLGLPVRILP